MSTTKKQLFYDHFASRKTKKNNSARLVIPSGFSPQTESAVLKGAVSIDGAQTQYTKLERGSVVSLKRNEKQDKNCSGRAAKDTTTTR